MLEKNVSIAKHFRSLYLNCSIKIDEINMLLPFCTILNQINLFHNTKHSQHFTLYIIRYKEQQKALSHLIRSLDSYENNKQQGLSMTSPRDTDRDVCKILEGHGVE